MNDSPTLVLHGDYAQSISRLCFNNTDELDTIPLDSPPKVIKHKLNEESLTNDKKDSLANIISDYEVETEQSINTKNKIKNDDDDDIIAEYKSNSHETESKIITQEENNSVDKHKLNSSGDDFSEVDSQILEDFVAVDNCGLESNGKRIFQQFLVKQEECKRIAKTWLNSNWLASTWSASFTPVYVPFHSFSFNTNVEYKGEINKNYSGINTWLEISGQFSSQHTNLTACATSQINQALLEALQQKSAKFQYHSCTKIKQIPYAKDPEPDAKLLAIDVEFQKSWQSLRGSVMETEKTYLKQLLKDQYSEEVISNSRQLKLEIRIVDFQADILYLPFYMSTFCCNSQVYDMLISGTCPVVDSSRPSSLVAKLLGGWWK